MHHNYTIWVKVACKLKRSKWKCQSYKDHPSRVIFAAPSSDTCSCGSSSLSESCRGGVTATPCMNEQKMSPTFQLWQSDHILSTLVQAFLFREIHVCHAFRPMVHKKNQRICVISYHIDLHPFHSRAQATIIVSASPKLSAHQILSSDLAVWRTELCFLYSKGRSPDLHGILLVEISAHAFLTLPSCSWS